MSETAAEVTPEETAAETEPFDAERAAAKIKKANDEAKSLRGRLRELEPIAQEAERLREAQKTEAQKLADRAEAAERRAQDNESALNRYRVALKHGLAESDIEDLNWSGSDEDIEARVKRFVERQSPAAGRPRADADQGARTSALPLNGDPIEAALKSRLGIT